MPYPSTAHPWGWRLLTTLWLFLVALPCLAELVTYPKPETAEDKRSEYPRALLQLALALSQSNYTPQPTELVMTQSRAIAELAKGTRRVDVLWSMTSREREQQLLAIRIPIDKGLLGWRVGLIRDNGQARFAGIRTAVQLKGVPMGQGYDWPDLSILKANGYEVFPSSSYEGLFRQLRSGKIDYFPRSVEEVLDEIVRPEAKGLMIEPNILLHYPAARYFFVNRQNTALASAIQRGLEAAVHDGSFEAIFQRHHADMIERLKLGSRRILELQNPLLPDETPTQRRELWYSPENPSRKGKEIAP